MSVLIVRTKVQCFVHLRIRALPALLVARSWIFGLNVQVPVMPLRKSAYFPEFCVRLCEIARLRSTKPASWPAQYFLHVPILLRHKFVKHPQMDLAKDVLRLPVANEVFAVACAVGAR